MQERGGTLRAYAYAIGGVNEEGLGDAGGGSTRDRQLSIGIGYPEIAAGV
jgi:hypothetical protein